jgi:hypothetical protein
LKITIYQVKKTFLNVKALDLTIPYGMNEAAFFQLIASNNGIMSQLQEQFQPIEEDEHKEGLPLELFDKIKKMKMGESKKDCSVCYNGFKKGRFYS